MVWLDAVEEGGNGLYLEVLDRERRRSGSHASVLLGDGAYEGEVQIEWTATEAIVTFVDHWLRPQALAAFFARIARDEVEQVLVNWCRTSHKNLPASLPRPARHQRNAQRTSVQKGRTKSHRFV
jgi:hypothetical protein